MPFSGALKLASATVSAITLLLPSPPAGSWTIGVPAGAFATVMRTRMRSAGSFGVARGASIMSTSALSASVGSASLDSAAGTCGRRCSVTLPGIASVARAPLIPSLT